jgi:PAS domain S-box-containing protein
MSAEAAATGLGEAIFGRAESDPSTHLLRQIVESSPVVTVVAEAPDFRIVYANAAAHRAARSPAGALVGEFASAAFVFVDPRLIAAEAPTHARAIAGGEPGEPIWWDVSYAPLDNAAGVLISAVDVTHHEVAKAKAQSAQNTLDALLEYIPDGISISYGPEVHVERMSARGRALVGRNADELLGHSALEQTAVWKVYRPGSDVPLAPAERPLARATRTGKVTLNETLLVKLPDGEFLTVLCNSGPIRDADGQVSGAVMAWHDIGELHRAQAAVRDSEGRLRAVLEQIPVAMYIVEPPDGRTTFKSRQSERVLGELGPDMDAAKAARRGWAVHEDGSAYDLAEYPSRRALVTGETVRAEPMIFIRPDGTVIDLEVDAGPILSEAGEILAAVGVVVDVTERRRAEARQDFLFRLQDALRNVSKTSDILAVAATLLGRHIGAARIGYGELQADGETMLVINGYTDGAPPVNGLFPFASFGARYAQAMREGRTMVYEDVVREDEGARGIAQELGTGASVSAPLMRDGRFIGCFYVTRLSPDSWAPEDIALIEDVAARIWDTAERGRAEDRLRESEERLRLALESSGLGFWEYDAVAGTTIRSARHDEIFGYPEPVSDWSYERFKEHVSEPYRELIETGFLAASEQGKDWDVECRIVRADGSHGWLHVRAKPQFGRDGTVTRLLGTVSDITERKQAQDAAIQTAAKFETFAQTMPSMVWTSLPDGQIDWFNARVCEYSGIAEAEMKPDGWAPVHPEDVARAGRMFKEALASGQPYETEYRIRRHDGMYRWHITRAVPIRGSDGAIAFWIGTSADIQDQKSSEEALAQLNATLEEQVRVRTAALLEAEESLRQSQKMEAVGQLTGGLAHDFNNLLTGIIGSLDLLSTRVAQGRLTELDRYLQTAQTSAKRAASLTHRLLAFSRRQTLDPKPTDINKLIYGMDELVRRTVTPAVAVTVADAPDLWRVLADPHQLENALLNLCINARDAMPGGGDLIIGTSNLQLAEAEAKTLDLPPGDYVALDVSDTGAGMTADIIARAFDPFFTTKPIGAGTGLGLSMVYGFARQSGGQARIMSEPGHGAKVSLYLPRYDGDESILDPAPERGVAHAGSGETVLVVDDEDSVRMLLHESLTELGYEILQVENAAAGLKILQSNIKVDLLITDVGLPGGMNGRQLADAALVTRPDLKVLFITGYAEKTALSEEDMKPGMHILTKPFSLGTLSERVSAIIKARA